MKPLQTCRLRVSWLELPQATARLWDAPTAMPPRSCQVGLQIQILTGSPRSSTAMATHWSSCQPPIARPSRQHVLGTFTKTSLCQLCPRSLMPTCTIKLPLTPWITLRTPTTSRCRDTSSGFKKWTAPSIPTRVRVLPHRPRVTTGARSGLVDERANEVLTVRSFRIHICQG